MSSTSVGSIPQLKKLVNHLLDWSSHSKCGWSWWRFFWTPRFHGLCKSFLSHKHIQLTATFQKQQWKQLATQLSFQVRQWFGAREREEQQCLETLHEPPALLRPGISSVSKQASQDYKIIWRPVAPPEWDVPLAANLEPHDQILHAGELHIELLLQGSYKYSLKLNF